MILLKQFMQLGVSVFQSWSISDSA